MALSNGDLTATNAASGDYERVVMTPGKAIGTFSVYLEFQPALNWADAIDPIFYVVGGAFDATVSGQPGDPPADGTLVRLTLGFDNALWSGLAFRSDGVTVYVWGRDNNGAWDSGMDPGIENNGTATYSFPAETFYFAAALYAGVGATLGVTINGNGDFAHTIPAGFTAIGA